MMRFTLIAAIVALARAGHDSWGCAPEEGWTDTEHPDNGLPSNFCVVGGDGQPIAKGLPGFATGGIVGIVVLGAAGADGKPKLACVTSKAAYPDLTVDIMAMGPTFQYCTSSVRNEAGSTTTKLKPRPIACHVRDAYSRAPLTEKRAFVS